MGKIRIAVVGVGNCASSLVQGIHFYGAQSGADGASPLTGLRHVDLAGYGASDIEVVAAFDVDRRKVGRSLREALFARPNCTKVFAPDLPDNGVRVHMGHVLDSISPHMSEYAEDRTFAPADEPPADVTRVLRQSGAEVVVNYLPVGSQQATEFYVQEALDAGVALVNCIPVFIASDAAWASRFAQRGLPVVGDDIKAQVGATIVHRTLARLFRDRGVAIDATYQLNTGGNTDFLNMLNQDRLTSKRVSKTDAVQSQLDVPLAPDQIHIGPSDYVAWQKDNKVCFLRLEGRGFGGVAMNLELRLSVKDSPNSAGVSIDAIRCCKIAMDRRVGGPLLSISSYAMKHPPEQCTDDEALRRLDQFVAGQIER